MTSLGELAALVGGRVRGDSARVVRGVRPLATAGPDDLSFLTAAKYRDEARRSRAGALLVAKEEELPHDQLVCADAPWALGELLRHFHPAVAAVAGVHPTAVVAASAVVDPAASIGPQVVVGEASRIAASAVLHAGVVVGARCRVGPGSVIHPRAVLYDDTELGARVTVHAGAVLGADGFGYAARGGVLVKVPQVGRVVVEDDVEIGANTTIDRATLEETRIGAGSKLDNLVQVGHNVRLGKSCVLCGQAGIAGSTRLGDGVVLAGQAGVGGHLELGDGVQVAAKSAALQSAPAGSKLAGVPAVPLNQWRRQVSWLGRLSDLARRVRRLEKAQLEKQGAATAATATEEEGT
ncbi:MAG TPA: UDP-3-O-(3-hydroxymyristoyl)glucosamine N-acyltransferase [Thermoanaerobaculia bacterium]|nr:UDP-3-O-(3-hydroxymyristoyl)glucosamine N-acyltransferase [Thermoanaerobaculia bacterium]